MLVDTIWLLIRSAGHQIQDNPHSFVSTPKNVDERDELEQLRTCRLARAEHLHATQYVSSKESGGCGYCANRKPLAGFNTLADTHKHLISDWDWKKNGDLGPEHVIPGSADKVNWRCSEGHSFEQSLNNRSSKGAGCPVCSNKAVDAAVNALSVTHGDIASTWHPTLNGDRTPDDYVAGSEQVAWWSCPTHGEYKMLISRSQLTDGWASTFTDGQYQLWVASYPDPDPSYLIQTNTEVAGMPVGLGSSNYVIRCSAPGSSGPGPHTTVDRTSRCFSTRLLSATRSEECPHVVGLQVGEEWQRSSGGFRCHF